MPAALEFFYDFISPNAYLAWCRIRQIAAQHERELVLRPVLFAALLEQHGQTGPAEVAPKRDWMVRNCLRKAAALGIALEAPHSHPFNPLAALRAVMAAPHDQREAITDLLFTAAWAQSRDISSVAALTPLFEQGGQDTGLLAASTSGEVKKQLREATEAAIGKGVFGVPTVLADNELFFGFDDLPWLERYLQGDELLDETRYARWREVRPSAWRSHR